MKILILGGAGFLGSNLVRRCLQSKRNKVWAVDSLDRRLKSTTDSLKGVLKQIKFIKGDIRNAALMKKMVKDKNVIFNCAGQTSHPLSLKDPFFDVEINCLGNLTLLEAVRKYNKKALTIYPSSSTVIGRSEGRPVDESHKELPLDIYSANKGVAEKYYYIYDKVYGIKTLSLRFANLYGPYGKESPEFGFINYFIGLTSKGKTIKIYGNGKQTRNIMYIGDAVDLLYKCISNKKIFGQVYFAVHREHYSVIDIAKEIVAVFGRGEIKQVKWPKVRKKIEIGNMVISTAKLLCKIKFEPKYNLRQGLEKTKKIMEGGL